MKKAPGDEVIEDKGVKVFVDPAGCHVSFGNSYGLFKWIKWSSAFVFNNPNANRTLRMCVRSFYSLNCSAIFLSSRPDFLLYSNLNCNFSIDTDFDYSAHL